MWHPPVRVERRALAQWGQFQSETRAAESMAEESRQYARAEFAEFAALNELSNNDMP